MVEEKAKTVFITSDGKEYGEREEAERREKLLEEQPKVRAFCATFKDGTARTRVRNIVKAYNAFDQDATEE